MLYRSTALLAIAFAALPLQGADARSCHIIECRESRAGEICSVRSCPSPQSLVCRGGLYTVGDGYRVFRGGTRAQCEQRCEDDPNCNLLEYYYGNEGVKCNLYSRMPQIRWNSAHDATICVWE